uniref:Uncharacterized protein n=1 Tax=Nelumbo nucifera TaxID=4432 RepID=A0A822YZZ1_NELNU|nr:TPA_asm: hypothetical protein HUJ06_007436 [Nelumbo nucifera]
MNMVPHFSELTFQKRTLSNSFSFYQHRGVLADFF